MAATDANGQARDGWDGSAAHARALREGLAARVLVRDDYPRPLQRVAGVAVRTETDGSRVRAAAVLVDADTQRVLDRQVIAVAAMGDGDAPLSFRMLPALLQALSQLAAAPELVLVGGHGVAHPQGLGVAAHLGVVAGLPCIGVSGRILVGTAPAPHPMRGAYTALRARDQHQIGWLLRSHPDRAPLVVSPGHRVAPASTADLVMRFVTDARLPEPLRLATSLLARPDVD